MTDSLANESAGRRRLAIIGGGSSGLITLKMALEFLPDWEVVCFEKSASITGCWGNPYPGFVSTSTRYTTQFACFPICEATINPDGGSSREEFFRNGEYGQYLESFADSFGLREHIVLNAQVEKLRRFSSGEWELLIDDSFDRFDSVVICTGLAAKPKPIECGIPRLSVTELNQPNGLDHITSKRIVVIGGGESAVDYAHRLAKRELNNEVYLALHSGVRVSPRYHPIRGVPSDFLRNRLMLSVHQDIRNWLGQKFVESRIKYQRIFERLFPPRQQPSDESISSDSRKQETHPASAANQLRKQWTLKLTMAAKDELFNMFHNKSDDFLDAVGQGRIKITGGPVDQSYTDYFQFDSESTATIDVHPDLIVPAIGYESTLDSLTDSSITLTDFYLGCCHIDYDNLFLVGFARPIIGNIPTISEMQARCVCSSIADRIKRPENIKQLQQVDFDTRRKRYQKLNFESVYPVEMIPYCDRLALLMGLSTGPGIFDSLWLWWRSKLAPASTMHYFHDDPNIRKTLETSPIYMPAALIVFVMLMKPVDWVYRLVRWPFSTAMKQTDAVQS